MNQYGNVNVFFLQETKFPHFTVKFSKHFWGSKDVEWMHMDSVGASGGSIILWRKNTLEPILSYKGTSYVGIKALFKGVCINFTNVYATWNSVVRRDMWISILSRRNSNWGEECCIGGDFNIVVSEKERIGKSKGVKR